VTALLTPVLASGAVIDRFVFAVCAVIVLSGAIGVIVSRNPVYSALSLVLTLFGVAVLFVEQDAQFLAAVQVVVYAGAIVVLFLFVIMLIGVDREEALRSERLPGQRPLAFLLALATLAELLALSRLTHWATGARTSGGTAAIGGSGNTAALAKSVFTTYLLPFELTSLLLIIAVLAAVVLSRQSRSPQVEPPEIVQAGEVDAPMVGPGAPPPGVLDVDRPGQAAGGDAADPAADSEPAP
jgi:NADH-quinone oxidoreductase subunit J